MKQFYILITLTMIAALTMVSCKCSSKKSQEPTREEIQKVKQALADSLLTEIDALADEYIKASKNTFRIPNFELTEEEKMIKPDYLLDPSVATTLVTKSQKVNALAIYILDHSILRLYDMPLDENEEASAKLALELNHPVTFDDYGNLPRAERIKKEYDKCKENGDLAYFWQFQNAFIVETCYIIAQNPELFFSKITEEQWSYFRNRYRSAFYAIRNLSKFDGEMATLMDFLLKYKVAASEDESRTANSTIESAKQFHIDNKEKYIAKRNALLQ